MSDDIEFIRHIATGYAKLQQVRAIAYRYNPRILVYQKDKIKLYHYRAKSKKISDTPLLVVFATVNRPEILDLFPETSFIGKLLEAGQDVYLLDWGYPDANDSHIGMSDYVHTYLHGCVNFIRESQDVKKINLLGICQGGLLSLCYTALYDHIKNLILISTPIDFHTDNNTVGHLLKHFATSELTENLPGEWLTQFFIALRPFELIGKKYLRYVDQIEDEEHTDKFLHVEKWLHDAPDQTRQAFCELIEDFYQGNKLINRQIYLNLQKIDLNRITIPLLNITAQHDEIIPPSASNALQKYIASPDYTEMSFPSGHIGIYISAKVSHDMPKSIACWLNQRSS